MFATTRGWGRVLPFAVFLPVLSVSAIIWHGDREETRVPHAAPTALPTYGALAGEQATPVVASASPPKVAEASKPARTRRVVSVPKPPGPGAAPVGHASSTRAAKPPIPLPSSGQKPLGRAPAAEPRLPVGTSGKSCPEEGVFGRTEAGTPLICTRTDGQLLWSR